MVERVSQIPDKVPKDSLKGGEVSVDDEVDNIIAAERQRGSTLFLTRFGSSRVHSTESFARSMYCRDLDLVSVCMFVVIPGA